MINKIIAFTALAISATPALAADVIDREMEQINRSSWDGWYIGGSIGTAKAKDHDEAFPIAPGFTIPLTSEGENTSRGFHAGYMHQFGSLVVGAEYEYVDLDIQFIGQGLGPLPVYLEDSHLLKGRLGYAMGSAMAYVTGGMAYTRTNEAVGLKDWTPMVGAGVSLAVTDNIIIGGEYTHSYFDEFDGQAISGHLDNLSFRVSFKF